jgi:hypothetical protein
MIRIIKVIVINVFNQPGIIIGFSFEVIAILYDKGFDLSAPGRQAQPDI